MPPALGPPFSLLRPPACAAFLYVPCICLCSAPLPAYSRPALLLCVLLPAVQEPAAQDQLPPWFPASCMLCSAACSPVLCCRPCSCSALPTFCTCVLLVTKDSSTSPPACMCVSSASKTGQSHRLSFRFRFRSPHAPQPWISGKTVSPRSHRFRSDLTRSCYISFVLA